MQECAFLINNLCIEILDEQENRSEKYQYSNGLEAFVEYLNEEKNPLHKILCFNSTKENINVEVCSKCHPFYTGTQSTASRKGQVDKFNKKYGFDKK